jgi:toxin ParE1/3/4
VREVLWSEAALDDLDQALAYIGADNPAAARKVLDKIESAATGLGHRASGRPGRVAGTYEKTVTRLPYIIAYALQDSRSGRDGIVILRVIHTSRHWPAGKWPQ